MGADSSKMPRVQSLLQRDGKTETYDAFELVELGEITAVLTGPLLLDVGDTLRLRVFVAPRSVDVDAKVVAVDMVLGQMTVDLIGVPDDAFTPTLDDHSTFRV